MKPHDTTVVDHHISFIAKQHIYASQCVIGWELPCTCIVMNHNLWFAESFRAPALWRHDGNVNNQNMVMLPIFQGWLAKFTEQN